MTGRVTVMVLSTLLGACGRSPSSSTTTVAAPEDAGPPWFGDLDLYLVQGGSVADVDDRTMTNRLFENTGDGSFVDISADSGADLAGYGMGVTAGDYDNDGDVDLYVTNVGPNVLLRNDGRGRFTDVTGSAGVGNRDWGTSTAFFDADRDGDLDLFVLNYVNWSIDNEIDCYNRFGARDYCLPVNYGAPGKAVLYRNDGDGTFTDVTDEAGLSSAVATGLGVATGDFDGDGWPDLFVANDTMPDHLWLNRGDGTFVEAAIVRGVAFDQEGKAKAGMGVAAGDLDLDDDLDVMVCNLRNEMDSLFLNEGEF
ncbi:MAG: FG-GAP repeat domain-containing protein, partial [Planctomycetota bacterium]